MVFTFHDAIYALFPQHHLPLNRLYLSLMMPRFLQRADAIIAVSECSKRDAARLYPIDPARIHVVYEGVDERLRPVVDPREIARVRAKYVPGDAPIILNVNTIEPRKNLGTLFEAYQVLKRGGLAHRLLIVGQVGWLAAPVFEKVRALGLDDDITFTGYVDDNDLPALFSAADAFVFPSLYEGFGFPPLEAMACGVPVVCSNASSLPEVCGDAALLVPPTDVGALAEAMRRVLADPPLREALRERGLRQAARFRWEETARKTLAIYREARGTSQAR
jgi:glycosyltransferase involved in cell wall biosynthesis